MTLNGWIGHMVVLVSTASCLSGCVAVAAIPAVAGGIAAKKASDYGTIARARRDQQATKRMAPLPTPASTPRDASASASTRSSARSTLHPTIDVPIPVDPRSMHPSIVDAKALPPAGDAPQARSTPAATAVSSSSWTNIGRYVAARSTAPTHSVLLVRGSSSDTPAWVPCSGKPRAMIVRLDTVLSLAGERWQILPAAALWLDAFRTLGIPVILIGSASVEARAGIKGAFRDADLDTLLERGELRLGLDPAAMPAERASIAAKYCVIAIVGRDASDFPNASLPETSSPALMDKWGAGWFRVVAE